MCNFSVVLILAAAATANGIFIKRSNNEDSLKLLTDQCLECICETVSGCSQDVGCRDEGARFCGPFFISQVYWDEGGQPGHTDGFGDANNDFIDCAKDRFCSEEAVRGYMKRYARDCNGDGVVNCEDFALIHRFGASGCKKPANRSGNYYSKFVKCFDQD